MPVDDFPMMDNKDLEKVVNLEVDSIRHLINNCKFCMGLDESRQYLNGIFLHISNEKIASLQQMDTGYQNAHLQINIMTNLME